MGGATISENQLPFFKTPAVLWSQDILHHYYFG